MARKPDTPRHDRMPRNAECPPGSVQCRMCGRYFASMGKHLLYTHGLNAREYRARFPGATTVSQEARETNRANARYGNEIAARNGGRRKAVTYAVT